MRHPLRLFIILFGYCGFTQAYEIKPIIQSEAFLQSEPVTLQGAQREWKNVDYQSSEHQYGSLRVESGIKINNTSLSWVNRQEQQNHFNTDTSDYYYNSQNNQLNSDRVYHLMFETLSFKTEGLNIKQTFQPSSKLKLTIGSSFLEASDLQMGSIKGSVRTRSSGKRQNYNVKIDYYYDDDKLLDRPNVIAPSGEGQAWNAGLAYQPTQNIDIAIAAMDLAGKITWHNVPHTKAKLKSKIKVTNDNGFTNILSHIYGRESYQDSLVQPLQAKVDMQARYRLNQSHQSVLLLAKHVPKQTFWGIGGEMPALKGTINASIWNNQGMLKVGYTHKHANVSLGMDNWNPAHSHAVWLEMGIQ